MSASGRRYQADSAADIHYMGHGRSAMLRHRWRPYFVVAILALAAGTGAPTQSSAQTWTQAGVLRCILNPSIGFVIFGHQSMECRFQPVSGPEQTYEGAINTVGVDLGVTNGGRFAWAVFGGASGIAYGALAGEYVGASGDVGFGVGAGANVLVGGSNRSIALQPLSLEGSVGINVVAGLSQLQLRPTRL
jgi:Protein of unknown function (DUF992)